MKMSLFYLFSHRKLNTLWQFSAQNVLWRIVFSHTNVIIGEERDTDNKITSFFCVDAKTGKILWQNKTFNEQWWIGIEGVTDERLFLHGFKKPDMPEHKGIIAVDLKSGNELWNNTHCSFMTVKEPFVYGFKDLFERRLFYKIDQQNGEIIEELNSLPNDIEENIHLEKTDFQFPQLVEERSDEIWKLVIESCLKEEQLIKSLEYIGVGKFVVVNFHEQVLHGNQNELKNSFCIIDRAIHKKVYSDVLNKSTPYPVPDSFFMDDNIIYYIKERKTLVALSLPKA